MTSVLEQITAVATVIIALVLMVLAVLAVAAVWRLRALERRVRLLLDQTHEDVVRIVRNTQSVSDNINHVTATIRGDVDTINATVRAANERVQRAVSQAEHQLRDFNALVTVVREEAEQIFVSTASTVRGVERGTRAFRGAGGTDLASDELDAAEAADDTMTQEEGDGHDSNSESAAQALPAAPRIRPRRADRRRA